MTTKDKPKRPKRDGWSFVRITMTGKRLDPEKISKAIGIAPDIAGKLGDPVAPNSERRCKQGHWNIESGQLNWRPETQMKSLLRRVAPVKERLRKLIREDATIQKAYVAIALEPPSLLAVGYYFPSDLIGEFTSLGLDVNLLIYLLGTKRGEGRRGSSKGGRGGRVTS
jgi:hypothetical protein